MTRDHTSTRFDRASEILGAAHCGRMASSGPAPSACLQVLQMCQNAGGCPLLSFSRQGRRAQPPGDPRGLSNPVHPADKQQTFQGIVFQVLYSLSQATYSDKVSQEAGKVLHDLCSAKPTHPGLPAGLRHACDLENDDTSQG